MKNIYIMILLFFTLSISACSMIDKVQDTSTEKLSELIIKYCNETNDDFRANFREKINQKLNGQAKIKVDCLAFNFDQNTDISVNYYSSAELDKYYLYGDTGDHRFIHTAAFNLRLSYQPSNPVQKYKPHISYQF